MHNWDRIGKGFTLYELLVVIIIVGVLVGILTSGLGIFPANQSGTAIKNAKTYVDTYNANAISSNITLLGCVDRDTDGAGYISCQLLKRDKSTGQESNISLECSSTLWNNFCKAPVLNRTEYR